MADSGSKPKRSRPSGAGEPQRLAQLSAEAKAAGATKAAKENAEDFITPAIKKVSIKQGTGLLEVGLSKGGILVANAHIPFEEWEGLGYVDAEPLMADSASAKQLTDESSAILDEFGPSKSLSEAYQQKVRALLEGRVLQELLGDLAAGRVPKYLVYAELNVLQPDGSYQREPKFMLFVWRRRPVFPRALPVFHCQPVSNPQSEYGYLNQKPAGYFPTGFDGEDGDGDGDDSLKNADVKLHQLAAVMYFKWAWADLHDGAEPPSDMVEQLGPLQASHLLEGIIGFRRNFNPNQLTLESGWANKMRHSCAGALLLFCARQALGADAPALLRASLPKSQAEGVKPPGGDAEDILDQDSVAWLHNSLTQSQGEGIEPAEGGLPLAEGAQVLAAQAEIHEAAYEAEATWINNNLCARFHPYARCVFWHSWLGHVPDLILLPTTNDAIIMQHLTWPAGGAEVHYQAGPSAEGEITPRMWSAPKTALEAEQKIAAILQERKDLKQKLRREGIPLKSHKPYGNLTTKLCTTRKLKEKFEANEAARRSAAPP